MSEETQFKPKRRKTGGRVKGTPNKTTVKIKDAILEAYDKLGGVDYLVQVGRDDPKTFCTLLGKILPNEVKASVGGADGAPLTITWMPPSDD